MRRISVSAALSAYLALAGCIKDTRTIKLNADGSGTIVVTSTMKAAALQQIRGMARAFGAPEGKSPEMFSEEQARAKAGKMGDGVELVSFEKIRTEAEEGMKAVYSFKDITKLRISDEPEAPEAPGGMPGAARPAKKDPITFKYVRTPGGNSVLTVVSPGGKEIREALKEEAPEKDKEKEKEDEEEPEETQLSTMKEVLGGLKLSIQIEIPGRIVKTNTPHVSGSTVTLLEVDLDQMLGDMARFKKLAKANPRSLEEARKLAAGIPGMKACPDPELTIEFAPD